MKITLCTCDQHRPRSDYAYAQSDQDLSQCIYMLSGRGGGGEGGWGFNLLTVNECKIAAQVANSVDPDQMPHLLHLIWVYIVCLGLSVQNNC